jgi:hypothetical protein
MSNLERNKQVVVDYYTTAFAGTRKERSPTTSVRVTSSTTLTLRTDRRRSSGS